MKKPRTRVIVGFLTLVAIGVFGFALVRAVYYDPSGEIEVATSLEKKLATVPLTASSVPLTSSFKPELTIPGLKISARIRSVGITKKGNMATPSNFSDVGLYKYGAIPGEKGSAIIAGHVDNGLGLKAVFGNLSKIKIGDDIYVEMEKGKKVRFTVSALKEYDFNALADEVFNQSDGKYLKLITCSGTWMPELKTHDKRLVVTAVRAD